MISELVHVNDLRHIRFAGVKRAARPPWRLPALADGVAGQRPLPRVADCSEDQHPPDPFVTWMFDRAGLDVSCYRAKPLQRRLKACLRTLGVDSPEAARQRIEREPALLSKALASMLLGVTEFFRDPPVFDALAAMLCARCVRGRPMRAWSVACSDGSELYSLAMLVAELGAIETLEAVGTDCRSEAINIAQRGAYPAAALRNVSSPLRERYFQKIGDDYLVNEAVRAMVRWEVENMFEARQAGLWDLILWRNTAIYLKNGVARVMWHRLARALNPGGLLITGRAERPDMQLPLVKAGPCIYVKVED